LVDTYASYSHLTNSLIFLALLLALLIKGHKDTTRRASFYTLCGIFCGKSGETVEIL